MNIFTNYGSRLQAKSVGERQYKKNKIRQHMSNKFEVDPAFFELDCLFPDGTRGVRRIKVIHRDFIIELNPDRNKSLYFHAHPDEILEEGVILLNLFDKNWMVTSSSNMNEVMDRGMIQEINWNLKWIQDGNIIENEVVLSSVSRRSDGIDEKRVMVLPEDSLSVILPINEKTVLLRRDQRFIVWDKAFKITKVDRHTNSNLISLIILEDLIGENDNLELSIADYDQYIEKSTITGSYIVLEGSDILRLHETKTYNASVFIDDIETTNIVTFTIENSDLVEYSLVGNELSVTVKNTFENIGKTFKISADYNGLTTEKTIAIRGLV